jgi:hypothetical protein
MVAPVIASLGMGENGEAAALRCRPHREVPEPVGCDGQLARAARVRANGLFVKVPDRDSEAVARLFGECLRACQLGRVEIDVRVKRMCASHGVYLGTNVGLAREERLDKQAGIAALEALYRTYFEAGNSGDLDTYCSLFAFPVVLGGGGKAPAVMADAATWRATVAGSIEALASRGWATSAIDSLQIGLMAGDTGVITAVFSRLATDGSRIEQCTGNYLARKLGGEWKIVGILTP